MRSCGCLKEAGSRGVAPLHRKEPAKVVQARLRIQAEMGLVWRVAGLSLRDNVRSSAV